MIASFFWERISSYIQFFVSVQNYDKSHVHMYFVSMIIYIIFGTNTSRSYNAHTFGLGETCYDQFFFLRIVINKVC